MRDEYDFSKAKRGSVVKLGANKTRIMIRLDSEVLEYFKEQALEAEEGSYQTLINEALREHIKHQKESFGIECL